MTPTESLHHTKVSCTHCSYDLTGLDLAGSCPECGNPVINHCFKCDYELIGVDPIGLCPECGYPIHDSTGLGPLARSHPTHVEILHKGVFLVVASIIVWVLNIMLGFFTGMISSINGYQQIPYSMTILLSLVVGVVAIAYTMGWWKLSTTDLLESPSPKGDSTRRFLRVMLIIFAVLMTINVAASFIPQSAYNSVGMSIAAIAFTIILLGVFATMFIAQMLFLQWFAAQIHNKKVYKRSKLLVWLGPVLAILGAPLLFIGPLVALILYWNMLDWIRKDLKAIRAAH